MYTNNTPLQTQTKTKTGETENCQVGLIERIEINLRKKLQNLPVGPVETTMYRVSW
jgi:hypothetical protein